MTTHKKGSQPSNKRSQSVQLRKFKKAARELGADVPEEDFDRALRKVGSQKSAKQPRGRQRSDKSRR